MDIRHLQIFLAFFLFLLSCNNSQDNNRTTNPKTTKELISKFKDQTNPVMQTNTTNKPQINTEESEDELVKGLKRKYGENNKDIWGQGILSKIKGNLSERINLPDTSINIYDKPTGQIIGKLKRKTDEKTYYNVYLLFTTNKEKIKIDIKDLIEINYEGTCLKYYDKQDGYVLCLVNNYHNGIWIKIEELEKYGFRPMDWLTFLTVIGKCYYPLTPKSVFIYDTEEHIIDTLKTGGKIAKLTKKSINQYIQVELHKPSECGGCSGQQIGTGWIKAIDEKGHPRIWYYTRGC